MAAKTSFESTEIEREEQKRKTQGLKAVNIYYLLKGLRRTIRFFIVQGAVNISFSCLLPNFELVDSIKVHPSLRSKTFVK